MRARFRLTKLSVTLGDWIVLVYKEWGSVLARSGLCPREPGDAFSTRERVLGLVIQLSQSGLPFIFANRGTQDEPNHDEHLFTIGVKAQSGNFTIESRVGLMYPSGAPHVRIYLSGELKEVENFIRKCRGSGCDEWRHEHQESLTPLEVTP